MTMKIPAESHSPLGLLRLFAGSIKLIVLTGVVGALAGLLVSLVMHPRWTAKMTVQIGQLSSPAQGGVVSRLVENQLTAADRYNLPTSRLQVLLDLGLPAPDTGNRHANLIFDSLRATTGKSPDLLSLQVSAHAPDQAVAALTASFKVLSAEHQKVFEPSANRIRSNLESTSTRLAAAEREYTNGYAWLKSGANQKGLAGGTPRDILVSNMTALINTQIVELKKELIQLQEALEPTRSYPTRKMGDIYVPQRPTTPGRTFLIVAGAALGIVAGLLIALLRQYRV